MSEIRAIGLAIYTYGILENCLEDLLIWLRIVAERLGHPYANYIFSRRGKESHRIWKATPKNLKALFSRLKTEQPWSVLDLGWPDKGLYDFPSNTKGFQVSIKSREQPWEGGEEYRSPSYISIIMHPDVLKKNGMGITGLLQSGIDAWKIIEGVYGFVDVETEFPLHDNIMRNIDHLMSNLVPQNHFQEFRLWQDIESSLDKRVWKAFWGNYIGKGHLQQLGGLEEMRLNNPDMPINKLTDLAYANGIQQLLTSNCYDRLYQLSNDGILLTLSSSPLDWFNTDVQKRRKQLQDLLAPIAIRT